MKPRKPEHRVLTLGGTDTRAEVFLKAAVGFWPKVRKYNQERWGFKIKKPREITIVVTVETTDIEELNIPPKLGGLEFIFLSAYSVLYYENRRRFFLYFREEDIAKTQKTYKIPSFVKAVRFVMVEELNHLWECLAKIPREEPPAQRNWSNKNGSVLYYATQEHEFRGLQAAVSLTGVGKKLLKDVSAWRKKHGRKI